MSEKESEKRYIYQTKNVCPPELHFRIKDNRLTSLHFVGGGCPGNASMVSRLLEGKKVEDVISMARGIECRSNGSCPDQLAKALEMAVSGELKPAGSFRVGKYSKKIKRIAIAGSLNGDYEAAGCIVDAASKKKPDVILFVGNITGKHGNRRGRPGILKKDGIACVKGRDDLRDDLPPGERDWLLRLPDVFTFETDVGLGMAFYGEYIQSMPGFSDFDPFALEINMVCSLTDFMRDESVFDALAAMLPQFSASIILFGQTGRWYEHRIEGTTFISVGKAVSSGRISWAMLDVGKKRVDCRIFTEPYRRKNA